MVNVITLAKITLGFGFTSVLVLLAFLVAYAKVNVQSSIVKHVVSSHFEWEIHYRNVYLYELCCLM